MKKYIIPQTASIKEALVALNQISTESQSLLVVNEEEKLVGTLTDGDIRRGLILGAEISDCVGKIMHRNFKYILKSKFDVALLKKNREENILFIPVLDEEQHIIEIINLKTSKSHLPFDAVLMAGGKGERLRPLTEKIPKPLVKVGNKCIIDYNVDNLIAYGIRHINVTVNYLGEQIEEHFNEPRNGVRVLTFREPYFLGTMGSIKFIESFYNDYILIMNSDIFTDIDFEDFFLHFCEHEADMSVAAVPYNVSIPFGILELEGRNIKGVKEKPKYDYYANAGIYLIKKSVLPEIPNDTFFNATDLIEKLIKNNKKVIRYPLNGTWIDIGQHSELEKARDLVKHLK